MLQLADGSSTPEVLALAQHKVSSIATNDTYVFWADGDDVLAVAK